jgi:hypothetical protein
MMKKIITIVTIVALLFAVGLVAKPLDGQPLAKTAATTVGQVTRTLSNISNWGYWVYYNGKTGNSPNGSSGGIYPRGTAGAIYQDGFVWGGKFGTETRVGGQTYNIGTQPGRVITGGNYADGTYVLADVTDPLVRVFRIRPDYMSLTHAMLIADAAELNQTNASSVTEAMTQEIMDQYALDWEEWPTAWGAPYYDNDDDGVYTPYDVNGDPLDVPGIAQADQVVWYVVNDYSSTVTTSLYGSQPIGVELQTTLWAYNQPSARLGQIIFRSNKLINKSNTTLTEVYVSMWADPDLGDAGNDYAGCDTTLSLGYCYNGTASDDNYDVFGLAPPAFGYDFFQGPMVPSAGDTAIYELGYVADYKNLPMTSYGWFAAGSAISDPDLGDYVGTLQFYNLMKGYKPTEDVIPAPWTLGNVAGAEETKYPLYGDPTNPADPEIDGNSSYFAPGDRRMCVSSGPFDFAPGDEQEIVVAILGGLGADNIGSVVDLKLTDAVAQTLFDGLFVEVPKPPVSPNVVTCALETTVMLEWGSDTARTAVVEETIISGYEFEGYNVYQLPHATAGKDMAVRIATFDKVNLIKTLYGTRNLNDYEGKAVDVPIAYGNDNGIERYIEIDWDYIDDKPLYEGKTYYFAVTAYNQNQDEGRLSESAMESVVIPLGVTMQEAYPGTEYEMLPSEGAIETVHTGPSAGLVEILVVDPTAVTGHDYTLDFVYNADSSDVYWRLTDDDLGVVVVTDQAQLGTLTSKEPSVLVDGLAIRVSGPPAGIDPNRYGDFYRTNYGPDYISYDYAYLSGWDFDGNRWISGRDKGWIGLWGGLGNGNQHLGTSLASGADYMDVKLYFAGDTISDGTEADVAAKMANSKLSSPDRWSKCIAIDGWGTWGTYLADIPVAAYDIESTPPRRLRLAIIEDSGTAGQNDIWDMGWNVVDSTYASAGGYEYIYIINDDYDATYTEYLAGGSLTNPFGGWAVMYNISPTQRGSMEYLYDEFEMEIYASNINVPSVDAFAFTAPALLDVDVDIDKINVFPNPYYAYNELATTPYDQYVTFTHLPEKATIKIFNLAGVLVTTLDHDNASSQFEKWDLTNASNIPVASGMYIAHIDMPDEGIQKILKVMIVQKKQILEYY